MTRLEHESKEVKHSRYLRHREYYVRKARERYWTNPEKTRAYQTMLYWKYRERKRKQQKATYDKNRRKILLQNKFSRWGIDYRVIKLKCTRCGFDDFRGLRAHHKLPRSSGGKEEISNLEILCANCHAIHHFMEGNREKVYSC